MKYLNPLIVLLFVMIWIGSGCSRKQPDPYPKNPNYEINKPPVRFAPSKENLAKMIKQLQGAPYVWAEEGPDKFDCSGFTYYLYGSMGIEIPRVSREQAKAGKKIRLDQLRYGDLIFFATGKRNRRRISHVGVYLGNGWFTHASTSKKKVVYTNLFKSPYYLKRVRACRRYLPDPPSSDHQTTPWKIAQNTNDSNASDLPIQERATRLPQNNNQTLSTQHKAVVIPEQAAMRSSQAQRDTYYIQIGSFAGEPHKQIVDTLKRQGYRYKVIRYNDGVQNISKLLIGPYADEVKARALLQTIRQTLQPDAFLAQIR